MFGMSDEKFMMVSLDDPKMKNLSDVLGNKTCKKIIDYLADNPEASQKDLSDALSIPMNTMDYSIKKLVSSGLIQKRKNFFWSKKGKKIAMYELSNKSIVISPRKGGFEKFKSLLPAFMVTVVGSFAAFVYQRIGFGNKGMAMEAVVGSGEVGFEKVVDFAAPSVANSLGEAGSSDFIAETVVQHGDLLYSALSPVWAWFLAGGILALFVYAIVNWRKL